MKYFLAIFFICLAGCRTDKPPIIEPICTLDGFGGGDCVLATGQRKYLSPSEMSGFWATNQTSQANFSAWCYKISPETANAALESIKKNAIHSEIRE
jgi:hypothetical protein